MCDALKELVRELICAGNIYTKKKAALCATRIIRKHGTSELIESFSKCIEFLLKERNHGVFLAALGLIDEIITKEP